MSYKKKLLIMGILLSILLSGFLFRIHSNNLASNQETEENEVKVSEEVTPVDKTGDKQLYQYKNLDGLYFLNSVEVKDFEEILESWIKQNKYSCTTVTILGNINATKEGTYLFYLQIDDGQDTVLEIYCTEQDQKYAYKIKKYVGEIKNVEQMGGIDSQHKQAVIEAPADGYVPNEKPTDNDEEIILDNTDLLPEELQEEENELKKVILEELNKKEDLRRTFNVQTVKEKENKVEFNLIFQTKRPGTQGLKIIKDLRDETWNISWGV